EGVPVRPPVVEPADRPGRVLIEVRARQRDADVARSEKRREKTLGLRQVRRVPHHLVNERFFLFAELELGEEAEASGDPEIGELPVRTIRIIVEALVLAGREVSPCAEELEVSSDHQAERSELCRVLLNANLRDTRIVLLEHRVVADDAETP